MGGGSSRARVAPDDGYELAYLDAPTTGAGAAWGLKANVKRGLGSTGGKATGSGGGGGSGRRGALSAQGSFKMMGRRVINSSVHSVASRKWRRQRSQWQRMSRWWRRRRR